MYMQDGKPVSNPYPRKVQTPTKFEFDQLMGRVVALELKLEELAKVPQFVVADIEQETEQDAHDGDKPKRGRKAKEASE